MGKKLKGLDIEIIFIDNGSNDNSLTQLKKLHEVDKRVKVVIFLKNFGSHIALNTGLYQVRGRIV